MRAPYFTSESIDDLSSRMLEDLRNRFGKRHKNFTSRDSALIVLDMHKYFLEESSHAFITDSAAIVERIKGLIDKFTANNLPVFFTRHIDNTDEDGPMPRWWKDVITQSDPHSELIDNLNLSKGRLIEKQHYVAFYQTDLEDALKRKSVRRLVVTGVMTHLCCETTARSAFTRGYDVFFCVDGTASYNEDFHRASLLNLSHGFVTPVLVNDIIDSFEKRNEK